MSDPKFVIGMRDAFFNALYEIAKQDKNVIIIIQAILKLENCHTNKKYIANKLKNIAIHKSLKVSIVSSHSHHHSITYFL